MNKNDLKYMWRWSRGHLYKYRRHVLSMILLTLCYVALNLFQVNVVQSSIDAALVRDWFGMICAVVVFVILTAMYIARNYIYGLCVNHVEAHISKDIKNACADATLAADMRYLSEQTGWDMLVKLNDDIRATTDFIRDGFSNIVVYPLMAIGGFIYLACFNFRLGAVAFISMPVLAVLLNHMSDRAARIHNKNLERRGQYLAGVSDIVHGAETIRAYSMQSHITVKASVSLRDIYKTEVEYGFNDALTLSLIMAVSYIPQVVVFIYGGMLVMRGELNVSILFAYGRLISFINTPAINVFSSLNAMKKSCVSMKRIDTLLNAERECTDGEGFVPVGAAAVCFEQVYFGYGDIDVLSGVSFGLDKGQCIGISGKSGAGKTTLTNLLCGFYSVDSGNVEVLGRDIRDWNLNSLRGHIAYVSQDNPVISGTLLENIRYGKPDATREQILNAARRAGLSEFIDGSSLGLDTPLNENGGNLSGGQRQRVDLARAFLRDAQILIFDEPTSALDADTEAIVLNSLRELVRDKAAIIISHRPSTLDICERVYHLEDGVVKYA